jgi:hypothetical protein
VVYSLRLHPTTSIEGRLSISTPCYHGAQAAYPGLSKRAAPRPCGRYPCLALLSLGVAWPMALLPSPVVSYTTVSPLLDDSSGNFLWPCPRVSPPGSYPAMCSGERGLSSSDDCRLQSPGLPSACSSYLSSRAGSTPFYDVNLFLIGEVV